MGWGAATKAANAGGGGRYLKAVEGVTMRLAFTGEPYITYKRWEDGKMHIDEDESQGAKPMFLLEVVNLMAPSGVQQFECSRAAFRSIGKKVGDDPSAVSVIFEREGSGKNTKYNVVSGGKLSAEDKAIIAEAKADQRWTLDEVDGAQAFEDDSPKRSSSSSKPKPAPSDDDEPDDDVPF